MYAIVGASGNTGRVIAGRLLANGQKVRVIARNPKNLEGLVQAGAETFVADAADAAALTQAFTGAKAVYLMIPPDVSNPNILERGERVSNASLEAVQRAGVEYAVLLSSIGADKPDKTGPVVGLHNFEQKLNEVSTLKAVYLRAGYFMENLLPQVGIIQKFGTTGGPLRADLKVPMIAASDIGAAAADLLLKLDFTGREARELLGQRDVSYQEVASIIGNAIGKRGLGYLQFPPAQLKPALMQMGMSANMADLLLEMAAALNSGYMAPLEARSAKNSTPTAIETFVAERIAPQFTQKAAGA